MGFYGDEDIIINSIISCLQLFALSLNLLRLKLRVVNWLISLFLKATVLSNLRAKSE